MPAGHLTHRQLIHHWPELGPLFRNQKRTAEAASPLNHLDRLSGQGEYDASIEAMSTAELGRLIEDIIACLEIV